MHPHNYQRLRDASSQKLLHPREVEDITTLSRVTLWRRSRSGGDFPAPIKISANRIAWLASDVESWIASKVSAV